MDGWLRNAVKAGTLRPLDAHFAAFLSELEGRAVPALAAAAALVSQQLGEGHICADLGEHAGRPLFAEPGEGSEGVTAPPLADWLEALRGCRVVAGPEALAPLVLTGQRLYLQRYWSYERGLAERLRGLAGRTAPVDEALLADGLNRLFGTPGADTDWQRIAAAVAVLRPFAVISGGPGTGKTHTVSRVLALLAEQGLAAGHAPRIRLAAPTGKAAARLTESIGTNAPNPESLRSPAVLDTIPREAQTLHRLLGARPGRVQFRHDADSPLHLDVLLVDEASMVDLPLMARLVAALPAHARLILLGDRDQLASVEAGAVLGDICAGAEGFTDGFRERLTRITGQALAAPEADSPLADSVAILQRSWRFSDTAGDVAAIGAVARAVRTGDAGALGRILDAARDGEDELRYRPVTTGQLPEALAETAIPFYRELAGCTDPVAAMDRLNRFRVLCALRDGPFGVHALNAAMRAEIPTAAGAGRWYHGQPLIVTANDYRHGLFNGDTGVVLRWEGALRAFFPDPEGGVRHFSPQRLPAHETVYAMTVHKSQGSEFDHVLFILPDEPSPVVTRELIYTGITRARSRVDLRGNEAVLTEAVAEQPTRRVSGLREALGREGMRAAGRE